MLCFAAFTSLATAKQDETPRLWPHNVHLLLIQVNHPMASHRDWFSPHYLRLQEGLLLCWIIVLTTISVAPASPAIVCDFLVFCPNNLVFSIFRLPLRRQKLEDVWSFTLTQAVGNHIIFSTSLWKSFQNQICVTLQIKISFHETNFARMFYVGVVFANLLVKACRLFECQL